MSKMRKLQREVIKNKCYNKNGNLKSFESEWDKFHNERTEETKDNETVVVRKSKGKRKKKHYDNSKQIMKHLKLMKNFINDKKNQNKKPKNIAG